VVRIPEETLAAFLDGRLSAAERAEVEREIARSPEAYAEFIEAQAVLSLAAGDDAVPALVVGTSSRAARPPLLLRATRYAVPAALAATIAFIVLKPREPRAPVESILTREVAAASDTRPLAERLGADWADPAWPTVRGGGDDLSRTVSAFRLGARVVTLDLAVRAGDPAAMEIAARRLDVRLREADGGAALASLIMALWREDRLDDTPRRVQFAEKVRALGPTAYFDLGSCLEFERQAVLLAETAADTASAAVVACGAAVNAGSLDAPPAEWVATVRDVRALFAANRGSLDPPTRAELVRSALANSPR
jgi:hypothetical protein